MTWWCGPQLSALHHLPFRGGQDTEPRRCPGKGWSQGVDSDPNSMSARPFFRKRALGAHIPQHPRGGHGPPSLSCSPKAGHGQHLPLAWAASATRSPHGPHHRRPVPTRNVCPSPLVWPRDGFCPRLLRSVVCQRQTHKTEAGQGDADRGHGHPEPPLVAEIPAPEIENVGPSHDHT